MMVVESLVCSEQLSCPMFYRKTLQVLQVLQFSSSFCIFEPFPAVTVCFWDPSSHTEDNWGTQTQLIKTVQTFTDAPEGTQCIKSQGLKTFEQDEDVHSKQNIQYTLIFKFKKLCICLFLYN